MEYHYGHVEENDVIQDQAIFLDSKSNILRVFVEEKTIKNTEEKNGNITSSVIRDVKRELQKPEEMPYGGTGITEVKDPKKAFDEFSTKTNGSK